jgi:4'-phosphopantetheinyl transferase EntD
MNGAGLSRLFAAPVQAEVATPSMYDAPLAGAESSGAAGWAPKRRREFAAGRAAARRALSTLGGPVASLLQGADGAPIWPRGIVGSISHCEGFCGAVVAREADAVSLGFDVETAEPLPGELQLMIFRPGEHSEIETWSRQTGVDFAKIGFSAKEAFYKCYYPLARRFLEFRDVVIHFNGRPDEDLTGGAFHIEFVEKTAPDNSLAERVVGRWLTDGNFVYSGATLPQTSPYYPGNP